MVRRSVKTSGGDICVVMLADIQVDPSYQRPVKGAHKKYARNFNEAAMVVPVIAKRSDGSLWVVDGLQRVTAALKAGIDRWRCFVVESSGPTFEASLFKMLNKDRTGLTAMEQFNAALTAQEPTAVATKRAVEKAGLYLPNSKPSSSQASPEYYSRSVTCYGTIWKLTSVYGEENVTRALKLIRTTWPDTHDALTAVPVGAVCTLIGSQGDKVDDTRFASMVGRKLINSYLQAAKADIYTQQYGFMRAVARQYNKRLAKKNRLTGKMNLDDDRGEEGYDEFAPTKEEEQNLDA